MCSWKEKCPGESRRGWTVRYPGGRALAWVCCFVTWQMSYAGSSWWCGLRRQCVSIPEIKRGLAGLIRIALYTLTVTAVHVKRWVSVSWLRLGDVCLSAYDTRSVGRHGYVPLSWAGEHYSRVITRSWQIVEAYDKLDLWLPHTGEKLSLALHRALAVLLRLAMKVPLVRGELMTCLHCGWGTA